MIDAAPPHSAVFSIVRVHLEQQARDYDRKRHLHALVGISGLIALAGLGVGLGCLGFAAAEQKSTAAEAIGASLAKAITANPIRANVAGSVKLAPGSKVALTDGASVTLAANQKVDLDRNATVAVETPTVKSSLKPTEAQLRTGADGSLSSISTTYIIFHSQPYRNGRIESAWHFNVQNADAPLHQYCKYIVDKDDRHSYSVLLARDTNATPSIKSIPGFDYEEALQKCAWASRAS